MPAEGLVFADQHVGVAVAGDIDEFEIGIAPVEDRQRGKWPERLPVLVLGPLEEPRRSSAELGQVELTVAGEIEKLLPPAAQPGERRLPSNQLNRGETRQCRLSSVVAANVAGAQIALVEPAARLLGENSREPLA